MAGNWKNRYGTDVVTRKGRKEITEKGDLAILTPAQRRRVRHKENRELARAART